VSVGASSSYALLVRTAFRTAGHQPQVNQIGKKDRADGRAAVIRGRHRVSAEPDDEKPCEHDQDHDDGQGLPKKPRNERKFTHGLALLRPHRRSHAHGPSLNRR